MRTWCSYHQGELVNLDVHKWKCFEVGILDTKSVRTAELSKKRILKRTLNMLLLLGSNLAVCLTLSMHEPRTSRLPSGINDAYIGPKPSDASQGSGIVSSTGVGKASALKSGPHDGKFCFFQRDGSCTWERRSRFLDILMITFAATPSRGTPSSGNFDSLVLWYYRDRQF
jgi:hypothetical protein